MIALNSQKYRDNNNSNEASVSGVSDLTLSNFRDEMITLGDAIVAGVQQASGEEVSLLGSGTTADSVTESKKRKQQASSGSVGDFIRQRRQRK